MLLTIRLLTERHPDSGLDADETDKNALKNLVSEWDEKHFTYEVSVRYYAAVVQALTAVDPHHRVLGSRLHGAAKSNKYFNGFEQIPELRLSGILSEVPTMLTWM